MSRMILSRKTRTRIKTEEARQRTLRHESDLSTKKIDAAKKRELIDAVRRLVNERAEPLGGKDFELRHFLNEMFTTADLRQLLKGMIEGET